MVFYFKINISLYNTIKQLLKTIKLTIMKKILLSLTTIAILAIVLFACRKNDVLETTTPEDLFDNFSAANKSQVQIFEISGATGGVIQGQNGYKITFPPRSFVNSSNAVITETVIIRLRESNKKSTWLMDGLSATSQNDILISGGMMNIEANSKADGKELELSPAMRVPNPNLNAVVKAEIPRPAALAGVIMNLFLPDTLTAAGQPIVPTANAPVPSWRSTFFDFGYGPNTYIFQLPKLKWSNCDKFYNVPGPKTTIRVTPNMSAFNGATNVQVMFIFRNISSGVTPPPSGAYFETYANSIPVGTVADVVLIGKSASGKILFKVLPATTFTPLLNVAITPEEVPAATVTAYLNLINN
jgi:hypothetical protein